MRILSVIGTRPEAIKMAMVVKALSSCDGVGHQLCVTAQHRQMLDSVLELLDLKQNFDLDVMRPDQDLTDLTNAVMSGMRQVLAAALASFYARTPVGHVEAGLRTGDMASPWPEEMNRRLTDARCDRHFAPTEQARQNLLAEGLPKSGITVTGNTVIDTLLHIVQRLREEPARAQRARSSPPQRDTNRRLVLVTGHRRESFGAGFEQICQGLARLASRDDVEIVYPVHLNPRVREPVLRHLGGHPNIRLIGPLDYLAFVHLMTEAYLIITDSGGIQEEAPSLGKPVLVMRDVTERPEAVAAGTALLVGADADRITRAAERLLDDENAHAAMSPKPTAPTATATPANEFCTS